MSQLEAGAHAANAEAMQARQEAAQSMAAHHARHTTTAAVVVEREEGIWNLLKRVRERDGKGSNQNGRPTRSLLSFALERRVESKRGASCNSKSKQEHDRELATQCYIEKLEERVRQLCDQRDHTGKKLTMNDNISEPLLPTWSVEIVVCAESSCDISQTIVDFEKMTAPKK